MVIKNFTYRLMVRIIALISLLSFQYCGESEPDSPMTVDEPDTVLVEVKADSTFSPGIPQGLLANEDLNEASGIVVSRSNPDALWAHNDSGGEPRIFLVGKGGENLGQFSLKGIKNRDWEDIAIGPGPEENQQYLYIGDIGDNAAQYDEKIIYRFKEPNVSIVKSGFDGEVVDMDIIRFKFPDGKRDAETLMIDPKTKDLYVISKRESEVSVYQLSYPYSTTEVNTLNNIAKLSLTNVVAGDISADGSGILVKTYSSIYCWVKGDDETIAETFAKDGVRLPYFREPQGESIGWRVDGSGYYTVSEEIQGIEASLYFYMKL